MISIPVLLPDAAQNGHDDPVLVEIDQNRGRQKDRGREGRDDHNNAND